MPTTPKPVTFLSDFGYDDVFVGLCHAVIARAAPQVRVVDLTHAVPAHDVVTGAQMLADCVPYAQDSVHLAVVDPGVGSARAGLAVAAGDAWLVGPDNGLLMPAARRLGGATAAYRLHVPADVTARTFHGRDVFAPAAARLADGADPAELGDATDIHELVEIPLPSARVAAGRITADVRSIDRFGNVQLPVTVTDLRAAGLADEAALTARAGDRQVVARRAATFADLDTGRVGLIEDSFGWIALVVDRESAARVLGLAPSDAVQIGPAPPAGPPVEPPDRAGG